jgi:hypothetical protein
MKINVFETECKRFLMGNRRNDANDVITKNEKTLIVTNENIHGVITKNRDADVIRLLGEAEIDIDLMRTREINNVLTLLKERDALLKEKDTKIEELNKQLFKTEGLMIVLAKRMRILLDIIQTQKEDVEHRKRYFMIWFIGILGKKEIRTVLNLSNIRILVAMCDCKATVRMVENEMKNR